MTTITARESVCDLRASADDASSLLDSQMLFGETATVLDHEEEWLFVQAEHDGYQGWLHQADAVGDTYKASHWVSARHTLAFIYPDIKSEVGLHLSFGSLVKVDDIGPELATIATPDGEPLWLPKNHILPLDQRLGLLDAALVHNDAPYLWGGRSSFGLDCSGLVQNACQAAGLMTPRDSGPQQKAQKGFTQESIALGDQQPGDLVFWEGHVGICLDEETLIHANGYHMAVAIEPLEEAVERLKAQDLSITAIRRLEGIDIF